MSGESAASFTAVTKTFDATTAVEDVTFDVRAGRVVGLLGRNGAGKTTCLRILLGLTRPTSGTARILGRPYVELPDAARRVGVSMDGIGSVNGASGRQDLAIWARTLGLPRRRVDEVLEQVGLTANADRKIKKYSTGMRQRHSIACALLADPELLVLDEPLNGMDPDGIRWLRTLLRALADEGRTVVLSTHLLTELALIADDVVILQRSLRYAGPLEELTCGGSVSLEDRFFELTTPAVGVMHHA